MKVAVLKPEIDNGELIFKVKKPIEEKSFDELDKNGEFSEDLKKLNLQRYIIRRSNEIDRNLIEEIKRRRRAKPN